MKITLCLIFLMIVVRATAQTVRVNPQEARVLSLENAWNQALQTKDVRAMNSMMDEDLVLIDYDGSVMNKTQYIASIRDPAIHLEHVVNNSMQVQFYGRSAIVVGVYVEKGVKGGKAFIHRERFVDTWINRNGAWMCVASQATLIVR